MPNIRSLRLSRGMTLVELALEAGIPARTLGAIEHGHTRLDAESASRLACSLDVTPELLFATHSYAADRIASSLPIPLLQLRRVASLLAAILIGVLLTQAPLWQSLRIDGAPPEVARPIATALAPSMPPPIPTPTPRRRGPPTLPPAPQHAVLAAQPTSSPPPTALPDAAAAPPEVAPPPPTALPDAAAAAPLDAAAPPDAALPPPTALPDAAAPLDAALAPPDATAAPPDAAPPPPTALPDAAAAPPEVAPPPPTAPPDTAAAPPAVPMSPPTFRLEADGPHGCPLLTNGFIMITQGYGVGTHAPAATWGALDLAVDGDGDAIPDPAATDGVPVVATQAGIARVYPMSWPGGNFVLVEDAQSGWSTAYAHLSVITVADGQFVEAGALIGNVGSTGMASGPHLHYEVRHGGVNLDPAGLVTCWG